MHIVDVSSRLTVNSFTEFLEQSNGYWDQIYDQMDSEETLWLFCPNRYEGTKSWSPAMRLADYICEKTPFLLRNTIIRHSEPEQGSALQSAYETILFFTKDRRDYRFDKDDIRIQHVYEGNEWGERRTGSSAYHDTEVKRYNPDGKDPGNVWLDENRTETSDETVDEIYPFERTDALNRCIRAATEPDESVHGLWLNDDFIEVIKRNNLEFEVIDIDSPDSTSSDFDPWVVETPPADIVKTSDKLSIDDLDVYFQSSENMDSIESNSVQSIITSPPYWNLKDYGHNEQIGTADESYEHYHERMKRVWKECYDLLAPDGTMWIVVDTVMNRGDLRLLPQHIADNAKDLGFNHFDNIVWYKPTAIAGMSPNNIVNKHEYIVALSKSSDFLLNSRPDTNNGPEDPAVFESGPLANIFRYPIKRGSLGQDVLHKASYPPSLVKRLVRISTNPGDIVLDPFLGSGTTAEAALELDRGCIGYEINPDFRELIKERIGQRVLTDYSSIFSQGERSHH